MSNAANTAAPVVMFNGQPHTLLPLNWKQLKERKADIIVIGGLRPDQAMFTEEQQDALLRVMHASLKRSHPHVTEDFVAEYMDLGNVGFMLKAVFGQAEGQPQQGEATAATSQT